MDAGQNKAAEHAAMHGVHAVTPHLVCDGAAAAIDFYKKAFGATEMMRLTSFGGSGFEVAAAYASGCVCQKAKVSGSGDATPSWPRTASNSPCWCPSDATATEAK
jgi:hypothetical protein